MSILSLIFLTKLYGSFLEKLVFVKVRYVKSDLSPPPLFFTEHVNRMSTNNFPYYLIGITVSSVFFLTLS